MRFDLITIFPGFFGGPLDYGIVRRAREGKLIDTHIHDLRDFTHDRHRTVDDRPFGGGEGMVMNPCWAKTVPLLRLSKLRSFCCPPQEKCSLRKWPGVL
jgi:tRNA (guanine-N1)-methyltransferase